MGFLSTVGWRAVSFHKSPYCPHVVPTKTLAQGQKESDYVYLFIVHMYMLDSSNTAHVL